MVEEGVELRSLWQAAAHCYIGRTPREELGGHLQALQGCSEANEEICEAATKVLAAKEGNELDSAWTQLRDACLDTMTAINQRCPRPPSEHSHNERVMLQARHRQCAFLKS